MSYIKIIEKPNVVDFAKNGLKYKISVPDYVQTAGEKADFYFVKTGDLVQWDNFIVPIPGTRTIIQTTAINETLGWYNAIRYGVTIDETIEDLKTVYLFDKYYEISKLDTDKISFKAKINGVINPDDISFNSHGTPAGYEFINPNYVNNVGVDTVYLDNTYVAAKIYYRDLEVCELKLNLNNEGITELEAGKFLNVDFLDKGTIINNYERINDEMLFKIGFSPIFYGESKYPYLFDELKALPGKIPFNKYPDYDFNEVLFFNTLKNIDTYSEAFHKLIFYTGILTNSPVIFYALLYFTDGSNEQVVITSLTGGSYSLFQINFFISDLIALSNNPNKEIYKINISPHLGTDKIWFWVKEKSFLDKQFLFKNTFGFWEVLNCKGNKDETKQIKRDIYKKHVSAGYSSDEGEYTSDVKSSYSEFEVETGSKEKQEITQIAEALRSKEFYEIIDNKYVKCELMNSDVKILSEADDLQNIIIKYRHSFDD